LNNNVALLYRRIYNSALYETLHPMICSVINGIFEKMHFVHYLHANATDKDSIPAVMHFSIKERYNPKEEFGTVKTFAGKCLVWMQTHNQTLH